jgi:hypothetical protein
VQFSGGKKAALNRNKPVNAGVFEVIRVKNADFELEAGQIA